MKKQQKFKVNQGETIKECLERMREAGYMPVKRFEKPVYQEQKDGSINVLRQDIEFIGKRIED
ncbi:NETI motif-containing protein [Staphylococcus sp. SQ8-PEA]|uniref:NETI motif-containing protein n=1 Tax=Staphylococcus marylandisciuri TaxID=2981529 RepID=A0ABT2QQE2_9STAP|nr:NETI motif-containing protein [Staphylococcus marylandisciuri]MCU5746196.1 NETI motif-containing protein [Staphylococcus marylandisciuri]